MLDRSVNGLVEHRGNTWKGIRELKICLAVAFDVVREELSGMEGAATKVIHLRGGECCVINPITTSDNCATERAVSESDTRLKVVRVILK